IIFVVEPGDSPVLSGGMPGQHNFDGIVGGFVPETLDVEVYDEIIQVTTEQPFEYGRRVANEDGMLVGICSGAVCYAAP
ncbi:cysteine synthase A, partial [Bacillus cereus]|nr:cysteine synthase A [Bacillus cereus]